jgi:hypothetical protein
VTDDRVTKFRCPHCGRVASSKKQVPPKASIRCPACQQSFQADKAVLAPAVETILLAESELVHLAPTLPATSPATQPAPRTITPQPPPQQVIQVNVPSRKGNPVATAAMVLGIIAVLICWVPFLGLLALPLAALGVLLGLIGLALAVVGQRVGAAPSVVGLALSAGSVAVAIAITGSVSQSISKSMEKASVTSVPVARKVATPVAKPSVAQNLAPIPPQQPEVEPGLPTPKPAEPQWVDFPDAGQLDNVQVRVVNATQSKVQLKERISFPGTDGITESKDDLLAVYIEIKNLDPNRKVDYSSFGRQDFDIGHAATLKDDLGNRYKRITFGFSHQPVGRIEAESIYPGKVINDVLIFEQPVGNAKHLDLELPGSKLGISGVFRLRIPVKVLNQGPGSPSR